MSLEDLPEKIRKIVKQRIQEAKDRQIYDKAWRLARYCGSSQPKKHGAYWVYDDGKLRITWDDFAPNLWISWDGFKVFEVHLGEILRYRPDQPYAGWLAHLDKVYNEKVLPTIANLDRQKKIQLLKELKENWGINVEADC